MTVKTTVETALIKNIVETVNLTTFTAIRKHVVAAETCLEDDNVLLSQKHHFQKS